MDRCIAINIRGEHEGERCERKASKHGYCASHLRSKHIQKQLESQGIDLNAPSPKVSSPVSPQNLLEVKPVPVSKPVDKAKKEPKPPRLTKSQLEEQKEKAFAASFLNHVESKLSSGEDFTSNELYNYSDDTTEDPPIAPQYKSAPPKSSPPSNNNVRSLDVEDVSDTASETKELDPYIALKRRMSAVNFVKKMANFGVFVTCGIAEKSTPMLNGYTQCLMTKDDYNLYLDEAAESYADYLGFSEIAPEYKLLGLAGMVALEVISINRGLGQNIKMPAPKDYQPIDDQPEDKDKDFSPAFDE